MSREFKFRFWNGEQMINSDEITLEAFFSSYELGYHDDYKLMQFTGLTDANGVEIWEGDLVCIRDYCDNEFLMSGVVKFGVRGYPAFDIYNERNETYSDEYNTLTNDNDLKFEVFGNIYENPELLEDKK